MNTFLTGLAAMLLATCVQAQQAAPICEVPPPKVPGLEWQGQAAYLATAQVKGGRVVAVQISGLKGVVERRPQRAMVMAIEQALRQASCQPGEHVFTQRFDFDSRSTVDKAAPASSGVS
ncbi:MULTISPECIES: hypothetical protein [unclassified Roseateles]|uniref:hypothetical protein n=1 Tax=unclassified Roseateles TaxID=2626991 RepID=UPI000701D51B|nr:MULTISPECIES: hypothetical protein [unclassified Roseateles]KQW51413.1 hypothetical protein ASC81_01845 [Pelomonas sp. Root405]KRA77645.1 hypothetical protein ASD88_01845 [Pelomonas sp. Root662]